ncbi:MAG: adenylate/guanylate cyclase domain-containing protein [Chloroflexota bacterium]|nr:MAG: adenylate/guanylate cyclase domain-containing protein [Chloroflexota bacterium]
MDSPEVFIPPDRRQALARGESLPNRAQGAVLLADISGFIPLTDTLVRELGPRQGIDELTQQLNRVYDALIAEVERHGGSVIFFSGDAITCWFAGKVEGGRRKDEDDSPFTLHSSSFWAVVCALEMQRAMQSFAALSTPSGAVVSLAIKVAITAGPVRRFLVGDPQLQLLDVLAGQTLDRMARIERLAQKGETLVGEEVAAHLGDSLQIAEWRSELEAEAKAEAEPKISAAVITGLVLQSSNLPTFQSSPPPLPSTPPLTEAQTRPWLLAPAYERLKAGGGHFLAELRTAIALFLSFQGIDYDHDDTAGEKLDAYIRWVQHILARYEGNILQLTIGDKGSYLYISFGAPVAHGDDASRAVAVALELRTPPPELNFISQTQIGLSQGRMRAGAYGSQTRRTYGVLGSEANIAARLMSRAKPGQVLISKHVAEAAAKNYQFTYLETTPVKGRTEPIPVFEVAGRRSKPPTGPLLPELNQPPYTHLFDSSDPKPAATSALTPAPMIGRNVERRLLAGQVQALARGDSGGTILIEGEAGIGKSRLVADLLEQAHRQSLTCLFGGGDAIEQSTPYHAWRPIFRQLFKLDAQPDTNTIARRSHVLALLPDVPELLRLAPLLNSVLPLGLQENDLTRQMSGQTRADNTRNLLLTLLQQATTQSPTLIILEDAHWLDSASWVLARLVSQRVQQVLLVVVARPLADPLPAEYSQLLQGAGVQRLKLEALSPEETVALVCQRLSAKSLPEPVSVLIRAKAEGHPFFSEELAYALRDAGLIRLVGGECQLASETNAFSELSLPDTVEEVITSRIDHLNPSQQLILKVASVIGRTFPVELLRDIHPIEADKPQLPTQLTILAHLDITRLDTPEPHLAYTFKHAITREVAYNLMLFDQRRELHRTVAEWFERTYTGDLLPFYSLLAHHWSQAIGSRFNGASVNKAIDYLEKAGEQALRSYANQEAVRFLGQAVSISETYLSMREGTASAERQAGGEAPAPLLPRSSALLRRSRWERQLGEAYLGLGQLAESREHLERAVALLGWPQPRQRFKQTASLLGQLWQQLSHRLWPVNLVDADPERQAVLLEAARTYERLGEIHYWSNETLPAIYAAVRTLNLAERAGPSPELARAYANMCLVAGFASLRSLAEAYSRRAQAVAQEAQHYPALAWVLELTGVYTIGVGQWTQAGETLRQGALVAQQLEDHRRWEECTTALGDISFFQGKFAESLNMWPEVLASARRRGDTQAQSWGLAGQLRSLLALGEQRTEQALTTLQTLESVAHDDIGSADKINSYGVIALLRWRLGQSELAQSAAEAGVTWIGRSSPTGYGIIHGYNNVAEVCLALWEAEERLGVGGWGSESQNRKSRQGHASESQNLKSNAWQACQALRQYARAFPSGRPRAWLWQGLYEWLSGRPGKAYAAWRKGLAAAERLAMPYEQALTLYEIGRHLPAADPNRRPYLVRAAEIFRQLNAKYDLSRTQAVLNISSQ